MPVYVSLYDTGIVVSAIIEEARSSYTVVSIIINASMQADLQRKFMFNFATFSTISRIKSVYVIGTGYTDKFMFLVKLKQT